jgi:hypothetical protein
MASGKARTDMQRLDSSVKRFVRNQLERSSNLSFPDFCSDRATKDRARAPHEAPS